MSGQDKMWNDYIWTKHHPTHDVNMTYRDHGYNYIYYSAPNTQERLEMIYRSLGKQYDFDLEKFRMAEKNVDMGNKRRFTKNLVRFAKNPFGYAFWKRAHHNANSNPRVMHVWLAFAAFGTFFHYWNRAEAHKGECAWLKANGVNPEGTGYQFTGWNNNTVGNPMMMLQMVCHQPAMAEDVVVSPSKNQGYRKYFEQAKKYGMEPSSGHGH